MQVLVQATATDRAVGQAQKRDTPTAMPFDPMEKEVDDEEFLYDTEIFPCRLLQHILDFAFARIGHGRFGSDPHDVIDGHFLVDRKADIDGQEEHERQHWSNERELDDRGSSLVPSQLAQEAHLKSPSHDRHPYSTTFASWPMPISRVPALAQDDFSPVLPES